MADENFAGSQPVDGDEKTFGMEQDLNFPPEIILAFEEVAAFGRNIAVRWGTPYPVGQLLGDFLSDIVHTPLVYKKLIGMQMLLEESGIGAFANLHAHTRDPLLKGLVQLVMTDEAFHHKFGKIWADRTPPEAEP